MNHNTFQFLAIFGFRCKEQNAMLNKNWLWEILPLVLKRIEIDFQDKSYDYAFFGTFRQSS